jgi:molecular chaperone DnaK
VKDVGEQADAALSEKVKEAVEVLKKSVAGTDVEQIKKDTEELTKVLYELSSAVYAKANEQAAGADGEADSGESKDEPIYDAEYEVMDEDKKEE